VRRIIRQMMKFVERDDALTALSGDLYFRIERQERNC